MEEVVATLLVIIFIGVAITGAQITGKKKKKEANERKEKEQHWEEQIKAGRTPINYKLRERNRNEFFVYMYRKASNGQIMDLESTDFGDARDALLLAQQLRKDARVDCVVRRSKKTAAYIVIAQNVQCDKLNKYKSDQEKIYEFENFAFSPTEMEMIDEEEEPVAAAPQPKEEISPPEYTTGEEYERYVAAIMSTAGFEDIRMTPATGDFGADIIATKDGIRCCIQCKMYSNPVGIQAVQEIIGAKAHYRCAAAMVVTNSTFTPAAKQLAKENDVVLSENVI
jgi:hypothetical protein